MKLMHVFVFLNTFITCSSFGSILFIA
uniref:Uncharacterized protein n=1 Tax=Rhizophora mucronata TaxID=61149 RepID=A0A2P2NSD6_RHIMU